MPNRMMTGLGQAFNHIDPEQVSNGQLYSLMYAMHAQQLDNAKDMGLLRDELKSHKDELKSYKDEMKAIADAWKTTLALLKLIKLLAAIGIPIAVVYGTVKSGIVKAFSGI